ncbi:MAG: hypothetical protein ACOX0A_06495 [Thermoguttaceae bacterium]|jgi:hypothetical protein
MKRTQAQDRIVERNDHAVAKSASFRKGVVLLASAVLLLSILSAGGGCHFFSRKDYGNDGRYLDGSDATADWDRARMVDAADEVRSPRTYEVRETRTARSDLNADAYTTRGAVREVAADEGVAEQKSWTERMRDSFRLPFMSTKNKKPVQPAEELRLSEENRRLEQERLNALARERAEQARRQNVAEETVVKREKQEPTGLLGKLFPTQRAPANEEENLIGGRREPAVPKSSNSSTPKSGGAGLFNGRLLPKKTPDVKPWNRAGLVVESYDQRDFLPPMPMIEAYYSSGSVPVDRRAVARIDSYAYGDAASRDTTEPRASRRAAALREPEIEEIEAEESSSYRSSSYAPPRIERQERVPNDELPESPANNRRGYLDRREGRDGGAALSPVAPSAGRTISQTSGVIRSNGRGITRPISSAVPRQDSGIAPASFAARRPALEAKRYVKADPESLFGWSEETAPVVEAVVARYSSDQSARDDVDESFRDTLGSRRTYDWFEPDSAPSPPSVLSAPERVADATVDDYVDALTGRPEPPRTVPETVRESGDISVLNQDSLLAQQDASMLETPSESHAFDAYAEPNGEGGDLEDDLDSIVDGAIASARYAELQDRSSFPSNDVFSNSTVAGGGIASDLANAIMESVKTDETLDSQASALSESAPESLVARQSEHAVAAPLTQEEIAWIEQIKSAISSLLKEREEHKRRGDDVRICDARLRLLYLVIGEYDRAIHEIQDESDPLRTFWEKECRGLETLLQNQLEEIDPTFVAERLRSGLDSLAGLCQLQIRKSLLVEAPACYGIFDERVDPYEAGEPLYAYAELDYATSRDTDKGFSIDVECRWRLLRADGTPETPFETQRCNNLSETKLRDVVLNVSVPLPEDLEPGVYLLELEVSDLNAEKPATCVERLTVRVVDPDADPFDAFAPIAF